MSHAQKRVSSKVKQKQIQTKMLEESTKKMEEKLQALRSQVEQQKKMKEASNYESTINRWRKATKADVPLKDYAKQILADRKEALNKFGIDERKITGSKSFQPALTKIKSEKMEKQQKSGLRIPKLVPTEQKATYQSESKGSGVSEEPGSLPVQSIQNNFFKAKINTTELIKQKSLLEFLQEHFLQMYQPILSQNGITELDDLYHLTRDKMTAMGIKSGHQAKILKRIKQEMNPDDDTKTKNEKLEQPKEEKVSFGYGDGDINAYQEINAREEAGDEQSRDCRQQENSQAGRGDDSGEEHEDEDEEQDDVVMLTMPNMAEFSLQTNSAEGNGHETQEEQFNCFQCYRKAFGQMEASSDGRAFCSSDCLNKYLKFMTKACPECCGNFYKFNGFFEDGLWFCSLKCCPDQEKIEEMFMDWNAKGE